MVEGEGSNTKGDTKMLKMNNISRMTIIVWSRLSLSVSPVVVYVPLVKQVRISLSTLYAVENRFNFTQLDSSEGDSLTVNKTG